MENFHTIRYGNKDGELKFGHIHSDQQMSAFIVRSGHDDRHFVTMDCTGSVPEGRKGGTINSCPGSFQIKCGDDVEDTTPAFYVEAVNGDIVLNAKNGRIRMMADNIDMIASGGSGKDGNIHITANETVEIKCKNFDFTATSIGKVISNGALKLTGDTVLNIYGGIIDGASAASKINPSKAGPWTTEVENNQRFN